MFAPKSTVTCSDGSTRSYKRCYGVKSNGKRCSNNVKDYEMCWVHRDQAEEIAEHQVEEKVSQATIDIIVFIVALYLLAAFFCGTECIMCSSVQEPLESLEHLWEEGKFNRNV